AVAVADTARDRGGAHQPAAHAVADVHDVPSDRAAVNQVVERRDAVELVDGHSEQLGDTAQRVVRDPAAAPLHDLQRVDARRAFAVVVRELALDLGDFFGRQAHRSTSAI